MKWRPDTPVSESEHKHNDDGDQSVHGEDYDDLDEDDDDEEAEETDDDNLHNELQEEESEEDNFDDVDDLDTFSDDGSVGAETKIVKREDSSKQKQEDKEEEQEEEIETQRPAELPNTKKSEELPNTNTKTQTHTQIEEVEGKQNGTSRYEGLDVEPTRRRKAFVDFDPDLTFNLEELRLQTKRNG